jgi:aryl carrier-like protein
MPATSRAFVPPQTDDEVQMAAIWAELLGVAQVGREDDFFALGGHSLKGMRLVAQVERVWGVRLGLVDLFQQGTLGGFTAVVRARQSPPPSSTT